MSTAQQTPQVEMRELPDGTTRVTIWVLPEHELGGELAWAIAKTVRDHKRGSVETTATHISFLLPSAVASGQSKPEVRERLAELLGTTRFALPAGNVTYPALPTTTTLPPPPVFSGLVQRGGYTVGFGNSPLHTTHH